MGSPAQPIGIADGFDLLETTLVGNPVEAGKDIVEYTQQNFDADTRREFRELRDVRRILAL